MGLATPVSESMELEFSQMLPSPFSLLTCSGLPVLWDDNDCPFEGAFLTLYLLPVTHWI